MVEDNGVGTADRFGVMLSSGLPTCEDPTTLPTDPLGMGDLHVVDAQPFPTSKDQCKNGAWKNFGAFKNQGDCVSFVATGGKNPPAGAKR